VVTTKAGTPAVTNRRHGKNKIFVPCRDPVIDGVAPFIDQKDGTLGFVCQQASFADDEAVFPPSSEALFSLAISAYVLCLEPRITPPSSGPQRTKWAKLVTGETTLRPNRLVSSEKKTDRARVERNADQLWVRVKPHQAC
jgi:hypothetical protein